MVRGAKLDPAVGKKIDSSREDDNTGTYTWTLTHGLVLSFSFLCCFSFTGDVPSRPSLCPQQQEADV